MLTKGGHIVQGKWLLKGCPRCHGDLHKEKDFNKVLWFCLLCARRWTVDQLREAACR